MRKGSSLALAFIFIIASSPVAGLAQQGLDAGTPTWNGDVAPIMADKCMNCHRPKQIAPMSLLTYEQVVPWGASVRMMVEAGNDAGAAKTADGSVTIIEASAARTRMVQGSVGCTSRRNASMS